MTTTPAVAQAAPNSQLLNSHPTPAHIFDTPALRKAALETTSGIVTRSLPRQQSQESLAPPAPASGMPSSAQGSGLASSKKHTLESTINTGVRSQSPPNKRRCTESGQAELTSQRDKAVNRAASEHTLKALADPRQIQGRSKADPSPPKP
ncbi:hypothetical protein WJX77_001654 [Trebouxia sp. C0004]